MAPSARRMERRRIARNQSLVYRLLRRTSSWRTITTTAGDLRLLIWSCLMIALLLLRLLRLLLRLPHLLRLKTVAKIALTTLTMALVARSK